MRSLHVCSDLFFGRVPRLYLKPIASGRYATQLVQIPPFIPHKYGIPGLHSAPGHRATHAADLSSRDRDETTSQHSRYNKSPFFLYFYSDSKRFSYATV